MIPTLGSVKNSLFISNTEFFQTFHVVEDSFPIPCDGIVGLDFIKNNNCVLDYSLNDPSWLVLRPNFTKKHCYTEIFDSPKPNAIILPARCEVARKINIKFNENEFFIPTQEIFTGVFVSNTITTKNNSIAKFLNTTNENILLENYEIFAESLSEYDVLNIEPIKHTEERKEIVLDKLKKNCPLQYQNSLIKLCSEYTDTFALSTDKVSCNNFYKQKLRLKDPTPVYIKNYRVPHAHKPEIESQIQKLIDDDIVEPSVSEYNSPILLVPKKSLPGSKEKKWRLVIDYRQVNKRLMSDKYPLPRIDDILDQLGRAKLFSCLDLLSGFHQIELEKSSRDITSFSSSQGSFRFKRLPFGLKIAPNSFQRMMSIAFSGLGPSKSFVYMDDLVVIGCSEQHMISNLKEVFEICRKTNLKLNPEKCNFFNSEVTFLGHKCTDKGILPDDSKYEKITQYPTPTNADEARRFVAFVNYYRRFIPNFSYHSIHLTRLTRKNTEFVWTKECESAFQYLKNSILSPKILQYPDFDKQFCITTDASKLACGAVLSQDHNGIQLPISFASRSFTQGESNKSVIEQELTAIHWAINFFKPYVYGKKFLVKSDHKPLTYLFSLKNPSSKLTRMRLDLEEFDFEIEYIKGKDNCGADALSRIDFDQIKQISLQNKQIYQVITRSKSKKSEKPQTQEGKILTEQSEPKVYESLNHGSNKKLACIKYNKEKRAIQIYKEKKNILELNICDLTVNGKIVLEQFFPKLEKLVGGKGIKNLRISQNDEIFKEASVNEFIKIGSENLSNIRIAITPKIKVITDESEKLQILKKFHDDPILGGHPGTHRLLQKIKRLYHWKNLAKSVKNYVKNCDLCNKNKSGKTGKEPMYHTPTPEKPFSKIQIDTIGPLPITIKGNEYALTIMCELTKYLIAVPMANKAAKTVASTIVDNCILTYGPVKQILTDQGSEYKNQIMSEVCKLLNIEHTTSTPYHHQTLGMVERSHRTFNEYLRSYLSPNRSDWDTYLKYFAYCYNVTPSTTHGYAPFELVFGKIPEPFDFTSNNPTDPVYNFEAYDKELKFRLQEAHKRAFHFVEKAKAISKSNFDKTAKPQLIKVNDRVYLKDEAAHKLSSIYKGPYQVLELDDTGNCKLQIGNKSITVHKNRLKIS